MSDKNSKSKLRHFTPLLIALGLDLMAVLVTSWVVGNWENNFFSHYSCGFSPPPQRIFTSVLTISGFGLAVYGTILVFRRQDSLKLKILAILLLLVSLAIIWFAWAIVSFSQLCLVF